MYTQTSFKVAVLTGLLTLSGCVSEVTEPDKYSGFLKNYSDLKEAESASGQTILRWVDPGYSESKYDNIVYNPVTYYLAPKPATQVGQQILDQLLTYIDTKLKMAIGQHRPLVTIPEPRSLIFCGAITGIATSKEGLQFYGVVSVALFVARTQVATGHRTMDTNLYFEGKLIDAATNKPVIKVVRKGEGKDLNNESTPMAFETLKKVVGGMAADASMFGANKKPQ